MYNKKLFIFLVSLVFMTMAIEQLQAQDSSNKKVMQVSARAVVMDNLMLTTMRDLDLISPTPDGNNKVFVTPLESFYAGQFRVQGSAGSSVRVSYLIYEDIQEASGNGGIVNARYILSGLERDNQFQSMLFAPTGEFSIQLSEVGQYYLWVGAEMDLTRALPGEYFSEFIIEMEYI